MSLLPCITKLKCAKVLGQAGAGCRVDSLLVIYSRQSLETTFNQELSLQQMKLMAAMSLCLGGGDSTVKICTAEAHALQHPMFISPLKPASPGISREFFWDREYRETRSERNYFEAHSQRFDADYSYKAHVKTTQSRSLASSFGIRRGKLKGRSPRLCSTVAAYKSLVLAVYVSSCMLHAGFV